MTSALERRGIVRETAKEISLQNLKKSLYKLCTCAPHTQVKNVKANLLDEEHILDHSSASQKVSAAMTLKELASTSPCLLKPFHILSINSSQADPSYVLR